MAILPSDNPVTHLTSVVLREGTSSESCLFGSVYCWIAPNQSAILPLLTSEWTVLHQRNNLQRGTRVALDFRSMGTGSIVHSGDMFAVVGGEGVRQRSQLEKNKMQTP